MAAADDDNTSPTSSRERDDLLDLFERARGQVEFGVAFEGLGPGVVGVCRARAERNGGVRFRELLLDMIHLHGGYPCCELLVAGFRGSGGREVWVYGTFLLSGLDGLGDSVA